MSYARALHSVWQSDCYQWNRLNGIFSRRLDLFDKSALFYRISATYPTIILFFKHPSWFSGYHQYSEALTEPPGCSIAGPLPTLGIKNFTLPC